MGSSLPEKRELQTSPILDTTLLFPEESGFPPQGSFDFTNNVKDSNLGLPTMP